MMLTRKHVQISQREGQFGVLWAYIYVGQECSVDAEIVFHVPPPSSSLSLENGAGDIGMIG